MRDTLDRKYIGNMPIQTIAIADGAASNILSSEAKIYVVTASVSKLNGLSIRVAGNSFTTSAMTNSTPVIIVGFKIGRWIDLKILLDDAPRVLAESSIFVDISL